MVGACATAVRPQSGGKFSSVVYARTLRCSEAVVGDWCRRKETGSKKVRGETSRVCTICYISS
jgi:hypothetical protein